jgi:hypothetical protein
MIMKLKAEARAHGGCRASEKKNIAYGYVNDFLMSLATVCVGDVLVKMSVT